MRMQSYIWSLFLSLCGWCAASVLGSSAHAADFHSLSDIQASAEQHLRNLLPSDGRTLYIKADALDNRLRLAACPLPLEVFLPSGINLGTRVTAGVRCIQGTPWTIYVPVTVESEAPALVLNKALARNAAITAQDVEIKVQRVPGVSNTNLKAIAELTGQRLKRDLPAGTVLSPAMLQPEVVIHRGQQVTLVAMVSGIEVRAQGLALSDGVASSRIRVKNLNSAKVVEGLVDSSSTVRIDL